MTAAATMEIDGSSLSLLWVLPFAGILLSIALVPLVSPRLWHHHQGKIAAFWALAFVIPFAALHGVGPTWVALVDAAVFEYVPFILLLFALFTIAGGIHLSGDLHGSPATNTLFLLVGTALASIIGTTGASMVLIRPLLRANDERRFNRHVVIFFIFLVSNVGGALTPLGDPPLFLGFLQGVGFFWTVTHMAALAGFAAVLLLAIFFALDAFLYRREAGLPPRPDPTPDSALRLHGLVNLPLLAAVVAAILMSGVWHPGASVSVYGETLPLEAMLRDALLLGLGLASLKLTPRQHRVANGFTWGPIAEVARLFAAIFVAMIPAIAILRAGMAGHAAPLVALVTDPAGRPIDAVYFWLTGALSSVLDNAPTYRVFFNLAGGDAQHLMGPLASTLEAISAGAVFMGAMTYIGNAPNFMVRSIAETRGVAMPHFFGYLGWSLAVLVPVFLLTTLVFFA
jgi:Na+/H+ antiporter NhaD/arsenite permease-like protein